MFEVNSCPEGAQSSMLMRKNIKNDVSKDSPICIESSNQALPKYKQFSVQFITIVVLSNILFEEPFARAVLF